MAGVTILEADDLADLLSYRQAVDAVTEALRGGVDPAKDHPRIGADDRNGEILMMPASGADFSGVKVLTVARGNPSLGFPTIQGSYLLFQQPTLHPVALLEGAALTALRTPAVSFSAVAPVLPLGVGIRVVIFGAGVQAKAHFVCLTEVIAAEPGGHVAALTVVAPSPDGARTWVPEGTELLLLDDERVAEHLAEADLVICATTARTPLFDSDAIRDGAIVIVVGSHEPDAREVDGRLLARATVVVENVETAVRECGDIVIAIDEGHVDPARLVPMRQFVVSPTGAEVGTGPVVFKSSGMSWEDLVIAEAAYRRHRQRSADGAAS